VHPVDIARTTSSVEFLAIAPNNKIPQSSTATPGSLMESGAIKIYLADKAGKFLPGGENATACSMADVADGRHRAVPRPGAPFPAFPEGQGAYAEERYRSEAKRLYGVPIAGSPDKHSWRANIRSPIWRSGPGSLRGRVDLREFPNWRWVHGDRGRPAVQKGITCQVHLRHPDAVARIPYPPWRAPARFPPPLAGPRIYAVGDIHGRLDLLRS
jgi:GST-like protein